MDSRGKYDRDPAAFISLVKTKLTDRYTLEADKFKSSYPTSFPQGNQ
jgi:hypothetical protein